MYRLQDLTRFQDFIGSLHEAFTSPSQVELMAIKKAEKACITAINLKLFALFVTEHKQSLKSVRRAM